MALASFARPTSGNRRSRVIAARRVGVSGSTSITRTTDTGRPTLQDERAHVLELRVRASLAEAPHQVGGEDVPRSGHRLSRFASMAAIPWACCLDDDLADADADAGSEGLTEPGRSP